MSLSASAKLSQAEKNSRALAVDHLMGDLGRRTASGGAIAVSAQLVRMALHLATAAIMARLLAPADFGLVAMAATVTAFVGLFTDLGLSAATVQRREIDQATVSALFYINLGMGVLVMLTALVAAPLAAWFFGDDRVQAIVIAMALTIPLAAAGAQHGALLQRGMRWLTIHWTGLAAQLAGATVGILLAWKTEIGYWALVAQGWVTALLGLVLLWSVCPWRPGRVADWSGARTAVSFGLHLTAFNLINYFHRQADDVLIGWRWGASELGYYTRAYQLLIMPLTLINGPVGSAVVPALSRLQSDPERWRKAFLAALTAVVLVSSGLTAVLITSAEPLIAVLLGPGWSDTARIFSLLAISMFAATPMNAMGWTYISLGRTNRMFVWGLLSTPFYFLSFLLGLPFGASGVALSYSIVVCALGVPCMAYAAREAPVSTWQMLRVVLPITFLGVGCALVVVWIRVPVPADPLLELVLTGGLTGCMYCLGAVALTRLDPALSELRTWIDPWRVSASTR